MVSRAVLGLPSLEEFKGSTLGHGLVVTLAVLVELGDLREFFQLKQSCDSMSSPAQQTMQIHAERMFFGVPPEQQQSCQPNLFLLHLSHALIQNYSQIQD